MQGHLERTARRPPTKSNRPCSHLWQLPRARPLLNLKVGPRGGRGSQTKSTRESHTPAKPGACRRAGAEGTTGAGRREESRGRACPEGRGASLTGSAPSNSLAISSVFSPKHAPYGVCDVLAGSRVDFAFFYRLVSNYFCEPGLGDLVRVENHQYHIMGACSESLSLIEFLYR